MEEFLCSSKYLGNLTGGGKSVYPIWKETLDVVSREDSKYLIVLTGAIGCLGPDVKVSLLDGRELTIPEIIEERKKGKQHWVYSYDLEQKTMVPGKVVDALLSGKSVDNIVEVELDNGEKVQCTHNHPFLLTTGEYRNAEDLVEGDSLESLYRELESEGYESKKIGGCWDRVRSGEVVRNHKVVAVRRTEKKLDVYDLSIEKYHNFALTSGVFVHNTGKTRCAIYGILYTMCRILCLKDPWAHFNLAAGGQMSIVFFNLTKSQSESNSFKLFQSHLVGSPWFRERGIVGGSEINPKVEFPLFKYTFASPFVAGFGCFTADTLISTLDGRELTIPQMEKELNSGESLWVYSYDVKQKKMVPGRVSWAGKVKKRASLVAVHLDNGEVVRCTPDHRFMLRDGTYRQAQFLTEGDSLMSLYRKYKQESGAAEKISQTKQRNHKVVSVEFLDATEDVYDITVEQYHNFALSSGVFVHNSQGENVIAALMDEVDSPVASEVQRHKVVQAYENARRRLDSRFVIKGDTLGRFFMVASKQERLSFLNAFIAKYKNDRSVMIVDIPLWRAKPKGTFSTKQFQICVGDVYNPPFIIETDEQLQLATQKGFSVMDVPMDFYDAFTKDMVGALRDIAGVSVSHVRTTKLFPSESLLTRCYTNDPNPSKVVTIEVGLQDDVDFLEYLDLSALTVPLHIPRYIHVDYAFSGDGDAMGIGMSCIKGWTYREVESEEGLFRRQKVPCLRTDFVLRIKGRPGDKIPLAKVRKFILDLKTRKNVNIRKVSYDLAIATEDTKQTLERAGIACDTLSMDKDPQLYRGFRVLVEEERWETPFHPYLHFELKHLEDDQERNKIDHPEEVPEMEVLEDGSIKEKVFKGSKDVADGGVGSVCLALRECECPPDQEIMGQLLEKAQVQNTATQTPDVFQLVGIEVKREDADVQKGIPSEGVQTYMEMLRRLKKKQGGHPF